jgi:hypothetical protein
MRNIRNNDQTLQALHHIIEISLGHDALLEEVHWGAEVVLRSMGAGNNYEH